jgi:hypothetical protein
MDSQSRTVEIRLRINRNPALRAVADYLSRNNLNLNDEVRESLTVRFYPLALSAKGKLTREIAISSIAKLKSYIYEIEQLAGLKPTAFTDTSPLKTASAKYEEQEELEDDLVKDEPDSPKLNPDDLDRMFGVDK